MKALTLFQPWASLVADGKKPFETRSWATPYRASSRSTRGSAWTGKRAEVRYDRPRSDGRRLVRRDARELRPAPHFLVTPDAYGTTRRAGMPGRYNMLPRCGNRFPRRASKAVEFTSLDKVKQTKLME